MYSTVLLIKLLNLEQNYHGIAINTAKLLRARKEAVIKELKH